MQPSRRASKKRLERCQPIGLRRLQEAVLQEQREVNKELRDTLVVFQETMKEFKETMVVVREAFSKPDSFMHLFTE